VNGKNHITLVLSQPLFVITDPDMSVPIEPVEVISGQLAIPPSSAEDVFGTLMDLQVTYSPDQKSLAAGGVRDDELRKQMIAQNRPTVTPTAVPATSTAVGTTQVAIPTAVPSLKATPTQEVEASTDNNPEEEPPPGEAIKVRRIVIDAGHGGTDAGAPGRDRQYVEKKATLDIAKRVVAYLKEEQGLEVMMTRDGDYFITLQYRTDFANKHNADLFVSIHCNSNPKENVHGTEIYYYGPKASNRWAALAAQRENAVEKGVENGSRIPFFAELKKRGYNRYSMKLGEIVEKHIEERLGQHFRNIQHAPFWVLAHTNMPSILVETAFLSNQKEEYNLEDPYWRDKMAKAISDGILEYKDLVEKNGENQEARR
jgi:N-acetylmuramoyl-L-alanine amidase